MKRPPRKPRPTWQPRPNATGYWWMRRRGNRPDVIAYFCAGAEGMVRVCDQWCEWKPISAFPNATFCGPLAPPEGGGK